MSVPTLAEIEDANTVTELTVVLARVPDAETNDPAIESLRAVAVRDTLSCAKPT